VPTRLLPILRKKGPEKAGVVQIFFLAGVCTTKPFAAGVTTPAGRGLNSNVRYYQNHKEALEMQNQGLEYAGFWVRADAAIIDSILMMLITVPLIVSIYGWGYFGEENTSIIVGPADFLITWVLPAIVVIAFWITKQATPGKMAVSAKIVDAATGRPASPAQLVDRYFAYFVSMIPLFLGIIWVAFDKRKQGWHDKLAGTVVIKKINTGPEPVNFNNA
jgi:uncharacterized RDD family membrane protein YckC